MYDGTNWRIPRAVGNAIIDDNNNAVIILGKTASAVNYVKITFKSAFAALQRSPDALALVNAAKDKRKSELAA